MRLISKKQNHQLCIDDFVVSGTIYFEKFLLHPVKILPVEILFRQLFLQGFIKLIQKFFCV
jgi:hypothetical protein